MSELRPTGVDHLAICVDNLAAARGFYVDLLGCSFVEALPQFHQELLHAGATPLTLVCRPDAEPASGALQHRNTGLDHFCLMLGNSAPVLRHRLAEYGAAVEDEVVNGPDDSPTLSLYVRDPSGNLVELRAPL